MENEKCKRCFCFLRMAFACAKFLTKRVNIVGLFEKSTYTI